MQDRPEFCMTSLKSVWMQDKTCNTVQQYTAAVVPQLPFFSIGMNLSYWNAVLLAYFQLCKNYLLGHGLFYKQLHIPS